MFCILLPRPIQKVLYKLVSQNQIKIYITMNTIVEKIEEIKETTLGKRIMDKIKEEISNSGEDFGAGHTRRTYTK